MPGTARFPGLDWTFAGDTPEALAEAVGHAWVQGRAGGSVTVADAAVSHPWWPVLRAWLPGDAPLRLAQGGAEPLPQRPFPPIHLASLPRSGVAPWSGTVDAGLAWLMEREPWMLCPAVEPHPALAIALAAVASWGWRVCWRLRALDAPAALAHIGRRQLPLHLILDESPSAVPAGWQVVGHDELALWVQHEWPTIYLPR